MVPLQPSPCSPRVPVVAGRRSGCARRGGAGSESRMGEPATVANEALITLVSGLETEPLHHHEGCKDDEDLPPCPAHEGQGVKQPVAFAQDEPLVLGRMVDEAGKQKPGARGQDHGDPAREEVQPGIVQPDHLDTQPDQGEGRKCGDGACRQLPTKGHGRSFPTDPLLGRGPLQGLRSNGTPPTSAPWSDRAPRCW